MNGLQLEELAARHSAFRAEQILRMPRFLFLVGWERSQRRVCFAPGSAHVSRRVSLRHQ